MQRVLPIAVGCDGSSVSDQFLGQAQIERCDRIFRVPVVFEPRSREPDNLIRKEDDAGAETVCGDRVRSFRYWKLCCTPRTRDSREVRVACAYAQQRTCLAHAAKIRG